MRAAPDRTPQEAAKQRALKVLKQKRMCVVATEQTCYHAPNLLARPAPSARHDIIILQTRARCRYEQQRDQVFQQQFNIEQTSFAVQSLKDTKTQARVPQRGEAAWR